MLEIKNRLRILRGNKVVIPGCEPCSSITSNSLLANWGCNASVVDLDAALQAIPGSTIMELKNCGGYGRELFFVLPSGPPETPSICDINPCRGIVQDWYKILKELAGEAEEPSETPLEVECQTLKGIFS